MASSVESSRAGAQLRSVPTGDDWAVQAADTVERVVGSIAGKTAGPLTTVSRAVVFGLLVGFLGVTALVLFIVGAVRALDAYLPKGVWLASLVLGGIFSLLGLLLQRLSRRRKSPDEE